MPSSISIQNSQREIKYDYADFKKLKKLDRIISNSLTTQGQEHHGYTNNSMRKDSMGHISK